MSATTTAPDATRPTDATSATGGTDPAQAAGTYKLFRSIVPPELVNEHQPSAKQDLPDCKRIRNDTLSADSSAYGKARLRLELDTVIWLADRVYTSLYCYCQPAWKGRHVQLLDGSTFSLFATAELREAYPPPSNQYGESHWPMLRVVVAHNLSNGTVSRPEYGPAYGDDNECESVLTRRLLPRLPGYSVLLGDGNFGIFIIAYDAQQTTHDVLFRLSSPKSSPVSPAIDRVSRRQSRIAVSGASASLSNTASRSLRR